MVEKQRERRRGCEPEAGSRMVGSRQGGGHMAKWTECGLVPYAGAQGRKSPQGEQQPVNLRVRLQRNRSQETMILS